MQTYMHACTYTQDKHSGQHARMHIKPHAHKHGPIEIWATLQTCIHKYMSM